ncbi:MAG: hypothetical protein ACRC1M_04270 [Methanobacteriaceae archaeon]
MKSKGNLSLFFKTLKGYRLIEKDYLFDSNFYLSKNKDVKKSGINPLIHYLFYGYKEGRNPSPTFDNEYYIEKNGICSDENPLIHYANIKLSDRTAAINCEKFFNEDNTSSLNLSLKGFNGRLFLVNDSNNELRQHFDFNYSNDFDSEDFNRIINAKKKFCNDKNIPYYFFVIPDKSLVCKEYLPFDFEGFQDFGGILDVNCYFESDSHINYAGGKKLVHCYLSKIYDDFKNDKFERLFNNQILTDFSDRGFRMWDDLTWSHNSSYISEEMVLYKNKKAKVFKNKHLKDISNELPKEFKFVGNRKTEHYKNFRGHKDAKVLILRDSSFDFLKDVLAMYFSDVLLYWDHWYFNKDLIKWYKPDIILDIRTERFLEGSSRFNHNI